MRNDLCKALSIWAYYEATEITRLFVPEWWRECLRINYTRRRTGDWFSDTGSTQICSTFENVRNPVFSRVRGFLENRLEPF